ncbi:TonB-dependent receptor [Lysobacter xinjiangensis]|uniref:TonB-dependent receptor n=1 Tax=Cognatilysobacter xinjiangensis TaxID=546892 RepID=A0ABQ3C9N8_9GAMM|nr:TonB-dependent receptor [Lysobacter xinjiangensis]GGZ66652.1 TonB-dependent receptor [Lysobacter xinjiangensis]
MEFRRSTLRDAIQLALGAGALFTAASAFAQETAEAAPQALDRVQVTGSRIRQVDKETAQPVLVVSRQDIEKQGFQSVSDILQNITSMGTPPISRAAPLSAGENAGGTFISMRNLGAARTLVLVNGRRLGVSTSGLADVSTIPAVAVERIEVLKDGASSIYGSDAIAGVINIITRTNFEGAAGSVYYGQYGEGDGAVTRGDFLMGFGGDRGSVVVGAEWATEDRVRSADRPFSAFPRGSDHPTDNWTTAGQYGGFVTTATTAVPGIPTGTRVVLRPGGDPRNINDYVRQNVNTGSCVGATEATGCTPGSIADKSNTNLQTDLRTPLERRSVFANGTVNITDDIRFHAELLYSFRSSERQVAGYPMQAASFATPMSANSYYNPTGATISNWWRRTWEVPRTTKADLTTFRFAGSFEGSFEAFGQTYDWDVNYLKNDNRLIQDAFGNLNLANVRNAVGPSFLQNGVVVCGTPGNVIAGCVPWNPYLPYGDARSGGLTGNTALQNYLFQNEHSTGQTGTDVYSANVSGTLFDLPAGPMGLAVGFEHRKESGEFVPDALAVTGGSTNLSSGPTRGSYSVDEVYAEVEIPILSDLPFARQLSVNIASRASDFDTFGETVNNKFMLKWKPFESLMLRGTVADGFRAPTIADLYGGTSDTFSYFTDPCDVVFGQSTPGSQIRTNCANGVGGNGALGAQAATFRQLGQGFVPVGAPNAQTPVAFKSGSNPTLTPEISKSQTIGAVWSPGFLSGFNMAVDWWKVRIVDTIVADSPQTILNDCYIQGIASRCSSALFTRDPAQGYINFLSFGSRNAGYRKVEGWDVDMSYRVVTENLGTFNVVSNSTYTAKDIQISTNDPRVPLSNVGFANFFRIRSTLNTTWEKGAFGATWTARYYSGMKEGCTYFIPNSTTPNLECEEIVYAPTGAYVGVSTTPASAISRRHVVGSNTFHDVQLRWEAPWKATVAIGANNVFNHIGPVMYTQPSANVSYYGGFDIGRFLYMRYTQRF